MRHKEKSLEEELNQKVAKAKEKLYELEQVQRKVSTENFLSKAKSLTGKCFLIRDAKFQCLYCKILEVGDEVEYWGTLCGGGKLDYSGEDVERVDITILQLIISESRLEKKYERYTVGKSTSTQTIARKDLFYHYRPDREIPLEEFIKVESLATQAISTLRPLMKMIFNLKTGA